MEQPFDRHHSIQAHSGPPVGGHSSRLPTQGARPTLATSFDIIENSLDMWDVIFDIMGMNRND